VKELHVTCTWRSSHVVEVPDDYEGGSTLDDEWADQVDSQIAELVDWEWR
jgi:hypothetical protein